MRCISHREAVYMLVIHSIFDTYCYKTVWTFPLTRLVLHTCDDVYLILYITLHSTNLKPCYPMDIIAPSQVHSEVHSWLHLIIHSQPAWLTLTRFFHVNSKHTFMYTTEYILQYTPRHALMDASNCTLWHTLNLLEFSLPCKFRRYTEALSCICSQVHSRLHSMTLLGYLTTCSQVCRQDAFRYTHGHIFKHILNCTQLHIPSLLHCTLQRQLSSCSQAHSEYTQMYTPRYALK